MKKFFLLVLALLLALSCVVNPGLALAEAERKSFADLQSEFDVLIQQIAADRNASELCGQYLELAKKKADDGLADEEEKQLANIEDELKGIYGDGAILPDLKATISVIELHKQICEVAIEQNQAEMTENLKLQADYYVESVKEEKELKDGLDLVLQGFQEYPSNSTSKYLAEAIDGFPDTIYSTPASENGLSGTVYNVLGRIQKEITGTGYDILSVEVDDHEIAVADFFSTSSELAELKSSIEPGADYSMPPVGENAHLYLTYAGFSGALNLPIFYLGAFEACVEACRK